MSRFLTVRKSSNPASQQSSNHASAADRAECRRLHRRFGATYYFATGLFPLDVRRRTHAVYAFVRTPDDWVDCGPGGPDLDRRLQEYRSEFLRGFEGVRPASQVLRAFCDVVRETGMPLDEPLLFLDAMKQDLTVTRYPTFDLLRGYMRGSAGSVGVMMCSVMQFDPSPRAVQCAMAMGEAMQLTNFLRDVGEDVDRGRIYLPLEDLSSFGVTEQDILARRAFPGFTDLMRFEIERARALYRLAEEGIDLLPRHSRQAVKLASILYSRILDRIEERGYDVFGGRARTSRVEKLSVAARVMAGLI